MEAVARGGLRDLGDQGMGIAVQRALHIEHGDDTVSTFGGVGTVFRLTVGDGSCNVGGGFPCVWQQVF